MDTQLVTPAPKRLLLELDLIADFACPWSYLGKRSLERALVNLQGFPQPALRWHGFRAQPEVKGEVVNPQSWRTHLGARLPPGISVDFAHRSLIEAGQGLGIHFDFSKLEQLPDTREAHRLVALAAKEDKQSEVADGIFRAFFEEGRDIGSTSVIEVVARESGLSDETLSAFADPTAGRDEITAEEKRLRGFGVVATPNLLIN